MASKLTKTTPYWGWFFISTGSISFIAFLFASIVSKIPPSSKFPLIASIQNDWYYCFLVPLTIPFLVISVYIHWLSMKMFKHS